MNVLVCIPCLMTGGTEIQTLNLVEALITAGHEVTTVCYFEHSINMVERYKRAGSDVCLLSPEGKRPVGITNTIILLYKGLHRVLKDVKPDVAHVQYMAPGTIPILILRLLGVKKIIATTHTTADIYPNLRILHYVVNHILAAFQCITLRAEESYFGSSALYSEVFPLRKKGNHFTIYNALPCGMQTCDSRRDHQAKVIGVVSRLEPIKGMDLVVPAFAEVKKNHPEVKLIVMGDGTQLELMKQQAEELRVMDSIEWAGSQPQEELHKWYSKMDIVLMPSRSEGFGLTAIEAMANGCVVVASNTDGLPEVVKDSEVGLLHTPETTNDIAMKVTLLIEKKEIFIQMKGKLSDYTKRFSFEIYSSLMNNLYNKL